MTTTTPTITIRGTEHTTALDAYRHARAIPHAAPITLAGRNLTVTGDELDRLERSGASFAHLVMRGGMLMTIPAGRD